MTTPDLLRHFFRLFCGEHDLLITQPQPQPLINALKCTAFKMPQQSSKFFFKVTRNSQNFRPGETYPYRIKKKKKWLIKVALMFYVEYIWPNLVLFLVFCLLYFIQTFLCVSLRICLYLKQVARKAGVCCILFFSISEQGGIQSSTNQCILR